MDTKDTVNYLADLGVAEAVLALVVDLDLELGRPPLWFRQVVAGNHNYKKVENVHASYHSLTYTQGRFDFD